MDWIEEFRKKFGGYPEVTKIKENRLHGALTINFCEGIAQNYDFKLHRRPVNNNQTLTQGGRECLD
jgi:hypothetical protein